MTAKKCGKKIHCSKTIITTTWYSAIYKIQVTHDIFLVRARGIYILFLYIFSFFIRFSIEVSQ